MEYDGSRFKHGYMDRGGEEVGVIMRRVRVRSRGARIVAAIAVAATATLKDRNGFGLSMMSSPPIPLAAVPMRPGSGTLSRAEMALRNQLSVVLSRKLYMNVQLAAFQTPQADSFCHSCPMTSRRESTFLRSSLVSARCGGRVGVCERDRLLGCLGLLVGEEGEGDEGSENGRDRLLWGAAEVK